MTDGPFWQLHRTGPFCPHWDDPKECNERCDKCGKPCRLHKKPCPRDEEER